MDGKIVGVFFFAAVAGVAAGYGALKASNTENAEVALVVAGVTFLGVGVLSRWVVVQAVATDPAVRDWITSQQEAT